MPKKRKYEQHCITLIHKRKMILVKIDEFCIAV